MAKKISFLVSILILTVLLFLLSTPFGSVPPLGSFFNPVEGFWGNAEKNKLTGTINLSLEALQDTVEIYYDERGVPHIFARNEHDLYTAQGYVVARDRLFQMELQAYDAGGRLSEIVGSAALERDRNTRQWGMPFGAENAIEEIKKDEKIWNTLTAYSEGVNAYIESLSAADYPLEYKILNIEPEEWAPIKTALLLKNMSRTLAGGSADIQTSNTRKYFGQDYIEKWFSTKPDLNEPIIPSSREWNFEADLPPAPDSLFVPTVANRLNPFKQPEGVGSNNWAVSGEKTQSGYPILANDPHLTLTLPSIWYEMQLKAPGINTYGVTLQGAPGVIIGFNENVAWGVTNVSADVMDWYEIQFRDESKEEYWHDGQWKPSNFRIEEYNVKGEEAVVDTVVYTHHGPVSKVKSPIFNEQESVYQAQRWIAHDGSNDMKTFYELNRAENYDDYVRALKHFDAPAQNFAFVSKEGDIALWVNGKFPKKWMYQGQTVSDGTDPIYDWQGWVPRDHVPHIKNPERGFVSSANQESAAPDYPYYIDDEFAPFERGRRINDLLAQMENITVDDTRQMQLDSYSYYAETLLPSLLEWVDTQELNDEELQAYNLLTDWDYFMEADKIAPSVFRNWTRNFYQSIFYDEYGTTEASLRYPDRDRFVEVIKAEPNWSFIDNIETSEIETRQERATTSFKTTISALIEKYGELGDDWKWGYEINNDIDHLALIPGMGEQDLFNSGGYETINAIRGKNGPSWRMVVEMGPEVRGYGVYPGGQSGNPGSDAYNNFVEPWRTGQLFELNFLREKPGLSDDYPLMISMD